MRPEALASKPQERERRTNRRFPLSLKLRYLLSNSSSGEGEVLDISSGGILFQTTSVLPVGGLADLAVMWPYLLNGDCPLHLLVHGQVLRSGPQGTALKISRYEFRTAAKLPADAARLAEGGMLDPGRRLRLMR